MRRIFSIALSFVFACSPIASYAGSASFINPTTAASSSSGYSDDSYLGFGNTVASPDAAEGWNTTQTVDGLYLGLSDGQNTFIIGEYGDRTFDFAHDSQINPTIFLHSASQNTTQWLSFTHNQTDAVIRTGTGDIILNIAGGNLAPSSNDGSALGISGTAFSDLFLASGAVLNFDAGDFTITDGTNLLTFAGGDADFNGHVAIGSDDVPSTQFALILADTVTATASSSPALANYYGTLVEASSGTHTLLAGLNLTAPSVTGGAATVTNTATLYVSDVISATVSGARYVAWFDAGAFRTDGGIDLDADGVRITEDSDGAITFLGLGNGSDEDLTINLDDTSDTVVLSTSTGVTNMNLQMALTSGANDMLWNVVDGTDNTACTSQCTAAAIFGFDLSAGATAPTLVNSTNATADICLCAGSS